MTPLAGTDATRTPNNPSGILKNYGKILKSILKIFKKFLERSNLLEQYVEHQDQYDFKIDDMCYECKENIFDFWRRAEIYVIGLILRAILSTVVDIVSSRVSTRK